MHVKHTFFWSCCLVHFCPQSSTGKAAGLEGCICQFYFLLCSVLLWGSLSTTLTWLPTPISFYVYRQNWQKKVMWITNEGGSAGSESYPHENEYSEGPCNTIAKNKYIWPYKLFLSPNYPQDHKEAYLRLLGRTSGNLKYMNQIWTCVRALTVKSTHTNTPSHGT